MLRSSRWPPTSGIKIAVALALAILGVALLWVSLARPATPQRTLAEPPLEPAAPPSSSTSKPVTSRGLPRSDRTAVHDRVSGPVLPESDPVTVSIPGIDVRSRLVQLGVNKDGELEVPPDPARAGWFSLGAAPGALGPAVIAGHVTWNGAPAVFYRLGTMRPGDRVKVTREDKRTAIFTVTRVARFSKSKFPTRAVYGPIDHAGLRLITCGGTYDTARHTYLDNIVVFARLTKVRGPHS